MFRLPTPEGLKKRRKQLGITQAELAEKAKVSQPLIARIEAGEVDPRLSTVARIVDALSREGAVRGVPARKIMKSPVIFISPESTLKEASNLMERHGISQIPVVEKGKQIGSVSEEQVIREISYTRRRKGSEKRVEEVIRGNFPTVNPDTDIRVISGLMEGSSAVLVVERGEIKGIITRADLLKLM